MEFYMPNFEEVANLIKQLKDYENYFMNLINHLLMESHMKNVY
jgi:hypothetical protein